MSPCGSAILAIRDTLGCSMNGAEVFLKIVSPNQRAAARAGGLWLAGRRIICSKPTLASDQRWLVIRVVSGIEQRYRMVDWIATSVVRERLYIERLPRTAFGPNKVNLPATGPAGLLWPLLGHLWLSLPRCCATNVSHMVIDKPMREQSATLFA